jgi:hypothetical protein
MYVTSAVVLFLFFCFGFSGLIYQVIFRCIHNDLGVALASMGALDQALEHFRGAVELDAAFVEAQQNLTAALQSSR